MNAIFAALIFIAVAVTGYRQITWVATSPEMVSPMQALTEGIVSSAEGSVELAIGLIGIMAFFLGLMKVAEDGGLLKIIAKLVRPIMIRLFPEVPSDHPAMGAMILNISSNAMGLGNAATPFGIRAMQELDTLNKQKGTATNAMALFLAINTSSVTLLPTGVIAIRAAAGSTDPAGILPTTLFATLCSTVAAITAAKLLQRFSPMTGDDSPAEEAVASEPSQEALLPEEASDAYPDWVSYLAMGAIVGFIPLAIVYGQSIGPWIIPGLAVLLLGFGLYRKVRIYEVFVEGAKDGFNVAVKIIPYLVAILVAVGMFRNSGAMDMIVGSIGQFTTALGMPTEALPMALVRPLSGSGAFGVMAEIVNNPAVGPDSYTGYLVSTLQGSTETTFYVLAVYFGAVQVRRTRHALAAGLTADFVGIIAAVIGCLYLYG